MLREKLAKLLKIDERCLPRGFQVVGDIALLKLPRDVEDRKFEIGEAMLKLLPWLKTVCLIHRISGEFREPEIEVIAGDGTETIHREHGVLYKLDVARLMFSKGNQRERHRLVKLVKPSEVVVDMFAGIGYFSLPIAKFTHAKKVVAIEKNPVAFRYLVENVKLNEVENRIEPVLGDCRAIAKLERYQTIADRVIMGYFISPERFAEAALAFLKSRGYLHYHMLASERGLWKGAVQKVRKTFESFRVKVEIERKVKVKSYAPRLYHVVLDLKIEKKT